MHDFRQSHLDVVCDIFSFFILSLQDTLLRTRPGKCVVCGKVWRNPYVFWWWVLLRLFSAVANEGMISGSFVLKPNRPELQCWALGLPFPQGRFGLLEHVLHLPTRPDRTRGQISIQLFSAPWLPSLCGTDFVHQSCCTKLPVARKPADLWPVKLFKMANLS